MIQLSSAQLWVHDQDEALEFYTKKVGMEVRADVTLAELGNFRWLTVGPPEDPDADLGPLRMQNAIGRLSATPGGIRHAGPRLGEHNRAVLVDELGFGEAELRAGGVALP